MLEEQPEECRKPLAFKVLNATTNWVMKKGEWVNAPHIKVSFAKTLFFDPTKLYEKFSDKLDPYKRIHGLMASQVFPLIEGYCACGCGLLTRKYKTGANKFIKWATPDCHIIPYYVIGIINGQSATIRTCLSVYYGNVCSRCGKEGGEPDGRSENGLYADHIIPVKHGGGASWLSNYQWLCHTCHVDKTCEDFNHKRKSNYKPPTLF